MHKILYITLILVIIVFIASPAPENDYKITYTINIKEDGNAYWNVEYRTLLTSKDDLNSFENYSQQLKSVYLDGFRELMQKSASQAAIVTSRNMVAKDFTGDAAIQSTPTGTYGVVHYSFTWTNFAKIDSGMNIGDVFVGGLYLSRDNTLIIQYPLDYTVEEVTPQPDQYRDGLMWYGLRSFGAGEPQIVFVKTSFPWIPLIIIIFVSGISVYIYIRKIKGKDSEHITETIAEADTFDLEDRIVKLLKESGGSMYQSEIGRKLILPKSSVSSALNGLQNKNLIKKIKKGRENLIQLI